VKTVVNKDQGIGRLIFVAGSFTRLLASIT